MTDVKAEVVNHAPDWLHPSTFSPATFALLIVLAIFGAAFSAAPAGVQPYPSKPVRIITANSAGGTSDIFVRALGDELQKRWGQPAIIENRSGGGMNIAGRACAEVEEERRAAEEGLRTDGVRLNWQPLRACYSRHALLLFRIAQ